MAFGVMREMFHLNTMHEMFYVVVLPDGRVVEPKVEKEAVAF
jgi:hypothetical protein